MKVHELIELLQQYPQDAFISVEVYKYNGMYNPPEEVHGDITHIEHQNKNTHYENVTIWCN